MKKISLLLIVVLLGVTGISSCLDGGGNTQTGYTVGILDLGSSMQIVLKSSVGDLYAPELSKMEMGKCYYVYYTIDYDADANSSASVAANKYYTVSINSYIETGKYYLNSSLTDTSRVDENELPISDALYGERAYGYAEGYLFFSHVLKAQSDLQIGWDLSYDYNTMAPTIESGGTRYYDLFLRATKLNTSSKTATDVQYLNAYNMNSYMKQAAQKEKDAGNSTFTLRINYPSAIDTATNKITWSNKVLSNISVANFLTTGTN